MIRKARSVTGGEALRVYRPSFTVTWYGLEVKWYGSAVTYYG